MAWRRKPTFVHSSAATCSFACSAFKSLSPSQWSLACAPGSHASQSPAVAGLLATTAGLRILIALWTAVEGLRAQWKELDQSRAMSGLMETVLDSSQEWLWAIDSQEISPSQVARQRGAGIRAI